MMDEINNGRAEYPCRRSSYEGEGSWRDGRLGQAYDLVWAVLKERGEKPFRHPLLTQITEMDNEHQ